MTKAEIEEAKQAKITHRLECFLEGLNRNLEPLDQWTLGERWVTKYHRAFLHTNSGSKMEVWYNGNQWRTK